MMNIYTIHAQRPLISVVIPVYKVERFLDKCINSIVNQTYDNLEIILVDDGSPDNCPGICDAWANRDSRISVIHQENCGVYLARMAGINASTGDYITFVDSDDWVSNDMIECLLNLICDNNVQCSSVSFYTVSDYDFEPQQDSTDAHTVIYDMKGIFEHFNDIVYLWGKLYRRDLFENLPSDMPDDLIVSEDAMFGYFVLKNAKQLAYSSCKKYMYYRHSESVLSGRITYEMIDSSITAYDFIEQDVMDDDDLYPYFLFVKMMSSFFLLNSIIRNNCCLDRYDLLKKRILSCKKIAFDSKYSHMFQGRHRIGIVLLMISNKSYNLSIRFRTKLRGY